jgi:NAD(P)H dehydrogenase (quinone)
MLLLGLPYSEQALLRTSTGGTPYGASRLTSDAASQALSDDEKSLCMALGRRVAQTAQKLQAQP